MKRFHGQRLSGDLKIAVIANDALGNYVVATPLLQALRKKYRPRRLDFYSGPRTEELWSVDPNIDFGFRIYGDAPRNVSAAAIERGVYDLVVNLEASDWAKALTAVLCGEHSFVVGPCLGPDGRSDLPFANDPIGALAGDQNWTAEDLTGRFPFLCSGFIAELFCRLAYLDGPVPNYSVPKAAPTRCVPQLLIGVSASLREKLWPAERWIAVLGELTASGKTVGLLGAKPSVQRQFWHGDSIEQTLIDRGLVTDLRGCLTLPEVVGALDSAEAVLTIDNGILHLAASTRTPVVGLFRRGIHRLWTPPVPNVSSLVAPTGGFVSDISADSVLRAAAHAF